MLKLVTLTLFTGISLLFFILTLVLGVLKKRKILKRISLIFLMFFVILCGCTIYTFITKSYQTVKETMKPRDGIEIYQALFGKPIENCVIVLNYQDQVIPKIDYAIWLHVKMCPSEIKRILSKHRFTFEKLSPLDLKRNLSYDKYKKWFTPEKLGDTILTYEYVSENNRNIQTIWTNQDSTKVFIRDIFD